MTSSLHVVITCVKLLLLPSYFSTDFEVHRNWLATTYSLPISQWYSAKHSEWTIDYPPLFAWFEYFLAQIAAFVDIDMLSIHNRNYSSNATIFFQRLSVIITDFVFYYGSRKCAQSIALIMKSTKTKKKKEIDESNISVFIIELLLIANVTLLLIDQIHFQYNGFLFGILLISISHIIKGENYLGAFWFTVLLNFKHIYLYLAPAYFVYLLKHFCLKKKIQFALKRLIKLGVIVLGVFSISFGPFIFNGQILQVFNQLFPFKRGLSHAYWAPNFWALYNTADIGAKITYKDYDLIKNNNSASMTRGLVQEFEHTVFPSITPQITFILTIIFMLPCLYKLWKFNRNPIDFVRCLVLCGLTSFMFGWHVHEKALLLAVIPLTILVFTSTNDCSMFTMLSTISTYSVFPLLFKPFEFITKSLLLLVNVSFLYNTGKFKSLNRLEKLYLISLGPLLLLTEVGWMILKFDQRYPFLPLMLTSFHNSIGVIYCWIKYYLYYIFQ
ncbi:probable dolichyl pyrophosphate Glc1Man9GlcNAc2 alpha-1,3-glucosyltransferase [Melanaphis sacchari]|uniref:Alpha-1,3-glucosyltransferase n=1 Tax=Melanaphis sacchari TaxID=742174 RepID=A0A2H8U1N9_9HEMI|nr:probable dolichyl pyrophosphate Glc1Man9GlcNAc2 alpha-1,3-glucosyltransferase [Melanaphis sacchari]